jgi:hypothetical protein
MSISRMSPAVAQRPACSRATRRGGSRRTLLSYRGCLAPSRSRTQMRLFTEGNGSGRACCSSGRSKWDKQAPEYCQAFETRRIMTKQERRIARELAVTYFIFTFIWGGSYMTTDWGNVPQWITAGVAVSAVTVAAVGIAIQRSVARKRAAIDFFLKTEGDKQLLDAYDNFWSGIETMKKMPINAFVHRQTLRFARIILQFANISTCTSWSRSE